MSGQPPQRQPPPTIDSAAASPSADIVRELAGDIGARPAGRAAELRAAGVVAAAFEQVGVASVQLPVRVRAPGSWEALLYGPLGLLAVLVALIQPYVGLALAVLAALGCAADLSGRPLLTRLVPRLPSRNVLSIVPPTRQEIRRLVVMANLDTVFPSSGSGFSAYSNWWQSGGLMFAALTGSAALLTIRLFVHGFAATGFALAASLPPLIWLLRSGWLDWRAAQTPGAITNAGGVAALVALAAHAHLQPAEWVETWFLATSAGEARGDGLRAFLAANQFEADATYFVQLQSVGAGELSVAMREGGLVPRTASPLLARLVADAGVDRPALAAKPLSTLNRATQTTVVLRAGYDAISLVGVNARAAVPRDGDATDAPDAVDVAQIARAVGLMTGLLSRLDAEAAERNRVALLARASTAALMEQSEPSGE